MQYCGTAQACEHAVLLTAQLQAARAYAVLALSSFPFNKHACDLGYLRACEQACPLRA
jgi:hypothetical protein